MHKVALELGLTSSRFEGHHMSDRALDRMEEIKLEDRTDLKLKEWRKMDYYHSDICEKLLKECPDNIERRQADDLTVEQFINEYEKPNKPVIIQGLTKDWKTHRYWTFEEIYQRYKEEKFKIGTDDDGYSLRIKLKYFFEYLVFQKDDSPLYLFESSLEDRKIGKTMINHYQVPEYFKDDLMSILGEEKRPPFRWFLIGPKRSGTSVHQDPLNTSAWNTSLQGHKLWVLIPETVSKEVVKGKKYLGKDDEYEAISYFDKILPQLKKNELKDVPLIEFIQRPGDTVFVPGKWWHAVLNLDNTMAVTQNFMSRTNFDVVWKSFRKERKKLSCRFLKKLEKAHPDLYKKAKDLNEEDGFVMYDEKKNGDKRRMKVDPDNLDPLEKIEKKVKKDSSRSTSVSKDSDSSSSSSSSSDSSSDSE